METDRWNGMVSGVDGVAWRQDRWNGMVAEIGNVQFS